MLRVLQSFGCRVGASPLLDATVADKVRWCNGREHVVPLLSESGEFVGRSLLLGCHAAAAVCSGCWLKGSK